MLHYNSIIVCNRNIWQSFTCYKVLKSFKIVDNSFYFCPQTFLKFSTSEPLEDYLSFMKNVFALKYILTFKLWRKYSSYFLLRKTPGCRCEFLISLNSWSENIFHNRSSPLMVTGPCMTFTLIFCEMHRMKNLEIYSFIITSKAVIRI